MAASDDFERAEDALRPNRQPLDARLGAAALAMENRRFGEAGRALRAVLKEDPLHARALHLLAENAARQNRKEDALALLARAMAAAPENLAIRFAHANMLMQTGAPKAALAEAEALVAQAPDNPLFRRLKAVALEVTENYADAAPLWRALAEDYPARLNFRLRYGHALRGLGRRDEAVAAYRETLAVHPGFGAAWWALADLKTVRFSDADLVTMQIQAKRAELTNEDRTRLHFALGKALADAGLPAESFDHYAKANALQRAGLKHDPDLLGAYVARAKAVFTPELFRARAGSGDPSAAPIFLVGMARSGSTLIEQILASHSQVEGTRELADLALVSRHVQGELAPAKGLDYPQVLAALDAETLQALGRRYLESTRAHRPLGQPFFTDKMGPNFVHVGLIQLILPNARIVDVRRHPLATGLSIFAQLFPPGENHAYRLSDIGQLYRNYAELMAHFDQVLPGRVHRVRYEALVESPESEIRRLLDYLGLPFEDACLDFHKTERVVTTVSSEQVRKPLYRDALDQWRAYEPWLGPLKEALGPALDDYR